MFITKTIAIVFSIHPILHYYIIARSHSCQLPRLISMIFVGILVCLQQSVRRSEHALNWPPDGRILRKKYLAEWLTTSMFSFLEDVLLCFVFNILKWRNNDGNWNRKNDICSIVRPCTMSAWVIRSKPTLIRAHTSAEAQKFRNLKTNHRSRKQVGTCRVYAYSASAKISPMGWIHKA